LKMKRKGSVWQSQGALPFTPIRKIRVQHKGEALRRGGKKDARGGRPSLTTLRKSKKSRWENKKKKDVNNVGGKKTGTTTPAKERHGMEWEFNALKNWKPRQKREDTP